MKKILKKVSQVILRTADNLFLGGAITNTIEETVIRNYTNGEIIKYSPQGVTDWQKIIVTLLTVTLPMSFIAYLFYKGIINLSQFTDLFIQLIPQ